MTHYEEMVTAPYDASQMTMISAENGLCVTARFLFFIIYYLKWLAHRHYTHMYRLLATMVRDPSFEDLPLSPDCAASDDVARCNGIRR